MQWAWAKDERYVPAFLWAIHLVVFGCLLGVVILLTSCGRQPTFTTVQGIDVYRESGVANKEQFDCAFGAIFGANRRAEIVIDAGMRVYVTKDMLGTSATESAGAYVRDFRDIVLRSLVAGDVAKLAHETAHVALYLLYGDPDYAHSDPTFFDAPGSMEKVAGAVIRESCL